MPISISQEMMREIIMDHYSNPRNFREGDDSYLTAYMDSTSCIDKIYVHESRWFEGKRAQIIDIHYKGVGVLKEISPEEMEEQFQKHYQNKRKNGKRVLKD